MMAQTLQQDNVTETFPEGLSMQHIVNEDLMFRRHKRLQKLPELTYEFTEDPALLQQYYTLRSLLFRQELQVDLPPAADELDEISKIFVVRKGKQVVGGVRMQVLEAGSTIPTMIDYYGGNARDLLADHDMEKHRSCEFSRIIIDAEHQNSDVITEVYNTLDRYTVNEGFNFYFLIGMAISLRMHRRVFSRLNIPLTLKNNIHLPKATELTGQKFGLIVVDNSTRKATTSNTLQTTTA